MYRYAQNSPYYLMVPGLPIAISIADDKIAVKASHFACGSRFKNERIGTTYYLKYESSYISFIDNTPVLVEEIVTLDDLVYIEPYFSAIFHLKHKNEYLCLTMESLEIDCPINLQWAMLDISNFNCGRDAYNDIYDFLGPYQYDYVSVDGIDLLNTTKSFLLIPDGDFNKSLNCEQGEFIYKFHGFESNIANKLMFIENNGGITIYSEEFGYLQARYDEDNEAYYPVFNRGLYCNPIVLEHAEFYSTYYLKYENCYVKLTQREGVYYGALTNDIDEASIFQAISI